MTTMVDHAFYLDDDVFANTTCLFQKYDGSSNSSFSSSSRSSRNSVCTESGFSRSGRRPRSRTVTCNSDLDQQEGPGPDTKDNQNANQRERSRIGSLEQDPQKLTNDGYLKDNTNATTCVLCNTIMYERQNQMRRSRFTKSSLCSRCSEENIGKRYISYWGSPSYERGSWRRRFRAERTTDIDLTPLTDVLLKIDKINTGMGIPMDAYRTSSSKPADTRDTQNDTFNGNIDGVNKNRRDPGKKVDLHTETSTSKCFTKDRELLINVDNDVSKTIVKSHDRSTSSLSINNAHENIIENNYVDINSNVQTESDSEFENIFKESVGVLQTMNNNNNNNETEKLEICNQSRSKNVSDSEEQPPSNKDHQNSNSKQRRKSLRRKSLRRTSIIRLPVPAHLLNKNMSSSEERQLSDCENNTVNNVLSSRRRDSLLTYNSNTQDTADIHAPNATVNRRNSSAGNIIKVKERRSSHSNLVLCSNISNTLVDSQTMDQYDINNIPGTYEEFNSNLEKEVKMVDNKRSSLKAPCNSDKANLKTNNQTNSVPGDDSARRNSVSQLKAFWEKQLTPGSRPASDSSNSETEAISGTEHLHDFKSEAMEVIIPSKIKTPVQVNVIKQDRAASSTGTDEDETFRRIRNKLQIRQNNRGSIRRQSILKNKEITSSFLNQFLTVPGARTRSSDSETCGSTSPSDVKTERCGKRRVSFQRSGKLSSLSSSSDSDLNSSDSGSDGEKDSIKGNDCSQLSNNKTVLYNDHIQAPGSLLTHYIGEEEDESPDLNDTTVVVPDLDRGRKEIAENEHMVWRRGNKPTHLTDSTLLKETCDETMGSICDNVKERSNQSVTIDSQTVDKTPVDDISKRESVLPDTRWHAGKNHRKSNCDEDQLTTFGDISRCQRDTLRDNRTHLGTGEQTNGAQTQPTRSSHDVTTGTTSLSPLTTKRRTRAKLFSIAGVDDASETERLLNCTVALDSSDSCDVELSWRTRGYNTDFYMSRKSTTGSEIIDKFRQSMMKKQPKDNVHEQRRHLSRKRSALFTQIDD